MNGEIRVRIMVLVLFLALTTLSPSTGHAGRCFNAADFSKVVFIGDSLTAGGQNGGLGLDGQLAGYAFLLAQQAGFDITLPLVSEPGIPPKLQLINDDPPIIQPANGFGSRINILEQATNLAVPGHSVKNVLYRRPAEEDPLTMMVLGYPGQPTGTIRSQIEWAEALEPTFVVLWIGSIDFLSYATSGGTLPYTPVDEFEEDYQELLDRLEATGADLIVANIPDARSLAFFVTAEEIAAQTGQDLSVIGPILGIDNGDLVTLEGLPLIEPILTGQVPSALPDDVVLDAQETIISSKSVIEANCIIAREAYRRNIPLIDMNFLFKYLQLFGVKVDGKQLNTKFLGGLFSLDGVHPTNTGYAILANRFISTLNLRYHTRIKRLNIGRIAQNDPLIIRELLPDRRDVITNIFHLLGKKCLGRFREAIESNVSP